MTIVKRPILGILQNLIGIAPKSVALVLDEGNISLTLPIVPHITRRSQTIGNVGGIFSGILENVHSGADDETSTIQPYKAAAFAIAPYPELLGVDTDLWLLGVSLIASSGTPALAGAVFSLNLQSETQGWGRDDQSAPVTSGSPMCITAWDGTFTACSAYTGGDPCTIVGTGLIHDTPNIRLPRGVTLRLATTSGAAGEFRLLFLMGLFPAGLGQDVAT